ncbi:hypothetical protein [Capnocytophaga felis]|nr:hypothetical protein [Capnocytophaga felis]
MTPQREDISVRASLVNNKASMHILSSKSSLTLLSLTIGTIIILFITRP